MKKNDLIELEITDVTLQGSGVGRYEGMAVFVPMTAVGDRIICRIVKVQKSFCFGITDTIITPSDDRAVRGCDVYSKCGGCLFRHISYEAEAVLKQRSVREIFARIGGFAEGSFTEEPIISAEDTDRYRNKAQYPVAVKGGRAFCGFYAPRSHRVIECGDCLLQPKVFSDIVSYCMKYINKKHIPVYDETTHKGLLRHIYIRQGYHTKEIMICFVLTKRRILPSLQSA